jgi:YggT family protein
VPLIYNLVTVFFNVMSLAILGRVLLSWFNLGPNHPITRILTEITEPILGPLRRFIPTVGMIDLTPLVALLLLQLLEQLLLGLLRGNM